MVECLGAVALPFLPPSLRALMHRGASEQDLCDVFALLNQLMVRLCPVSSLRNGTGT